MNSGAAAKNPDQSLRRGDCRDLQFFSIEPSAPLRIERGATVLFDDGVARTTAAIASRRRFLPAEAASRSG
jgi:hypothetical protein